MIMLLLRLPLQVLDFALVMLFRHVQALHLKPELETCSIIQMVYAANGHSYYTNQFRCIFICIYLLFKYH